MDVHVRDLRYFLAVADELHFTRAAERLFVTQPALSKQVRALELRLRTPLFHRGPGTHRVTLTAAGHALIPLARRTVASWDEAQRAVSEAVAASTGTLVVNLSVGLGRGLLPEVRRLFAERQPSWRLDLQQVTFDVDMRNVADGAADVGFSWLPVGQPELTSRTLLCEPMMVALPRQHPLAGAAELRFDDLLDEPFLALPPATGAGRSFWLAEDHRHGRPVRIGAVVHGPEDTIEALAQGVGIALISAGNAAHYERPEFVSRPVTGLPPASLSVVWRRSDRRDAVRDVVACATEAARLSQPG
jgi:DNA-binding transcriptional LysR family regulator